MGKKKDIVPSSNADSIVAPPLSPTPPVPSQEAGLEYDLRQIYAEDDGKLPDLYTLEKARSNRLRTVLISLVFFFGLLAATAWAGFFVFQPGAFRGEGVKVSVAAPTALVAGGTGTLKIRYVNGERVPLGSFEIAATLPEGFHMISATPPPLEGTRWIIGSLASGQSGEIEIVGTVDGAVGTPLAFSAYGTYIPANFNSEFQAVGSLATVVGDSVLKLTVSGPDRTPAGEPVTYLVRYENAGDVTITGAAAELTLPPDLLVESVTPAQRIEDRRVPLPDVLPGASGEISIRGSYASDASGQRTVSATAGVLASDQHLAVYARAEGRTDVVGGDLVLTAVTNGVSGEGRVNFGDTLRTTLTYENRGSVDLTGVEITLVYEARPTAGGSLLKFDTFADESAGVRTDGRVTWTKKEVARLAKLAPGDEGTIDVRVDLADAPFTLTDRAYVVDVSAEARVAKVGDLSVGRAVKSAKTTLKLNSNVRFGAAVRYFNDDDLAVGTGPVPPRVGATTTYRVFWTADNSLHELTGLTLRVPLPAGVTYAERGQASAGEVHFDTASSTVVWTLNRMPESVSRLDGSFDVRIVPTSADAGKILPLSGPLTFEALDAIAGGLIVRTMEPLDTNLDTDPQVSGKGKVIE